MESVPSTDVVARIGARMIILDPLDRVLLIEEAGEEPGNVWRHWLTPGGGLESGESLTEGATREVVEETGLRIVLPAELEPVYVHSRLWQWQGVRYDQRDHLFPARVSAAFTVEPAALTEMEQQTVQGSRWWGVDELRASPEVFIPPDIADVLERVAADPGVVRPQARSAGRMLVLDHDGCVLLIQTHSFPGSADRHWIAPGGGIEDGESAADAAVRELFEETGITAAVHGLVPVTSERAVFPFADALYDQIDTYFVTFVDERPPIDDSRLSEQERELTTAYRWWSVEELRATGDTVWPVGLADAVATRVLATQVLAVPPAADPLGPSAHD